MRMETGMWTNIVWTPSSEWLAYPNMIALNFHDYENEVRRLIDIFGGDSTVAIPALNTSPDYLPPITLPAELSARIAQIYASDYQYDPRNQQ